MHDTLAFGGLVLAASLAALLAVQSHGLTARLRVPAPALFLAAAAVLAAVLPGLHEPDHRDVERVVTVALVAILFDGGLHIGAARFRRTASTVLSLGVLGTFATVLGGAVVAHLLLGGSWYVAVLVAVAVAPTDPAVVFSVLGQREIEGDSGTVLEGESGANDPVGIALMAALLGAGGLSGGALGHAAGTFALQLVVGLAVGLAGSRVLLLLMRRSPLPAEGLYPVRTFVGAGVLFGLATLAHGSGFLAVFVAGIALGDERAPYKREIERFHSALASLGEVVAFAYLGLTVHLDVLARTDVWVPGVLLAVLVALVVRPLLAGPLLLRSGLRRGEQAFVLLAGLKGAVPLLLGSLLVPLPGGERLYGVVVVVVVLSVVLQGGAVPQLARWLHVRMRDVEQEPFALGVRLREEPQGAYRLAVAARSAADGSRVEQVPGMGEGTWVTLLVRDHALVPVRGDTVLLAGDEVLLLVDTEQDADEVCAVFTDPLD